MKSKLLSGRRIQSLDNQVSTEPSTIMRPSFISYISASRGSGKTVSLCNLLINKNLLAATFNDIYFVSPTASLDSKLNVLKTTSGILSINTKLINAIKKLNKGSKKIMDDFNGIAPNDYTTSIPEENFLQDVETKFLLDITAEQKTVIERFDKETANKILIIYDDCIGNRTFMKSEQFQKAIFNSRHYNISIILTSQSYMSLPKPIRLNCSFISMFYTGNTNERKIMYSENSAGISFKEWDKIYLETCQKRPFNFMSISYQNPPEYRLIDAFESFIDINLNSNTKQ